MPKPTIPTKCAALLALPCALLLTACGEERIRIAAPPPEWIEPVAWPDIPPGEALCEIEVPDDNQASGALERCLSDRESADLMAGLGDALDAANGKLLRLKDWFAKVAKPSH